MRLFPEHAANLKTKTLSSRIARMLNAKLARCHRYTLAGTGIAVSLTLTGIIFWQMTLTGPSPSATEDEKDTRGSGVSLVNDPTSSQRWALRFVQAPASRTPSSTPSNDGGSVSSEPMPYPTKAVAVYHLVWANSGSPKLSALPSSINVVNLAFAQGAPPRLVGWSSQGEASLIADVKALRARGVRFVVSVGGAGGKVDVSNRTQFVKGIMAINSKIPLDGLDWDLEGQALNKEDVVAVSTELKHQRGSDFAITMAPNGSNIGEYMAVGAALESADALNMFGQQFYDAIVSYDAALDRVNRQIAAGIPENKIAIGMMVGDNSNCWTVSECLDAVRLIKGEHPNIRGGYLWESGRADTSQWASQVGVLLLQ